MNKSLKKLVITSILFSIISFQITAQENKNIFNSKINQEEIEKLNSGEILIRNINYQKYMCLNSDYNEMTKKTTEIITNLSPKYLAEIIQIKPYKENENLSQDLYKLLKSVSDYAGIPYYSEKAEQWYDLYSSAEIIEEIKENNETKIKADFEMLPFGTVHENINILNDESSLLYSAYNTNTLRYYDQFDCVYSEKMNVCILLFRDGDNWILYGIGGVNAPRIPFFTKRIQTSFINRINTFCNYIFKQF